MRLVPWIPPLFRDRAAAGRALAEAVAELELELEEPVVVGVARGGVAVALEVARELEAPLTPGRLDSVVCSTEEGTGKRSTCRRRSRRRGTRSTARSLRHRVVWLVVGMRPA